MATGIAVGGGAALLAAILGAVCFARRRGAKRQAAGDAEKLEPKEAPEAKALRGSPTGYDQGRPPPPKGFPGSPGPLPPGSLLGTYSGGRGSSFNGAEQERYAAGDLHSLDSRASGASGGAASAPVLGEESYRQPAPNALFAGRESPFDQTARARSDATVLSVPPGLCQGALAPLPCRAGLGCRQAWTPPRSGWRNRGPH